MASEAVTSDQAVARAVSRPTVLDRYQPHMRRRWNQGCRDSAVLHAEITALRYRGSLRTIYRYLQPLRAGMPPGAITPSSLKISCDHHADTCAVTALCLTAHPVSCSRPGSPPGAGRPGCRTRERRSGIQWPSRASYWSSWPR